MGNVDGVPGSKLFARLLIRTQVKKLLHWRSMPRLLKCLAFVESSARERGCGWTDLKSFLTIRYGMHLNPD